MIHNNDAQFYTLEGFIAASLMVTVLIFSVQATSITPLTSSAANEHVEVQLQFLGQDICHALDYENVTLSSFKSVMLSWEGFTYVWNGTYYVNRGNTSETMDNRLAATMGFTLAQMGIAHNVGLIFLKNDSDCVNNRTSCLDTRTMISSGEPSNNAVIVSQKIILHDSDIANISTFYTNTGIGDFDATTELYNIVDIRLTLWRV